MAMEAMRRQATLAGVPMKHISLITLTLQNSMLILIMHYSRVMPAVNGQRYHTSTAVFLNEVLKLAFSLSMVLYEIARHPKTPETSTVAGMFTELGRAVFAGDSWKLAIPAMLYTLQNTLQYVAVSNLDAATFQVTYQLRILTTALFSVALLGRTLSLRKWLSLVLLMTGVAIVQIPGAHSPNEVLSIHDLKDAGSFSAPRAIWELKALGNAAAGQLSKRSATYEGIDEDFMAANPQLDASIGLFAVAIACAISGLAGVYFEKILKDPRSESQRASVWVRNVQLSFYSLWPALFIGVLFKDGDQISKTGFFAGYNAIVWLAITLQAMGGVIVALVVNYADNIAKNFATSISILISFLASVVFFEFQITSAYLIGTGVVLAATYMYNSEPDTKSRPPPISVSDYEKNDGQSYFDLESVEIAGKSPLLHDARSTQELHYAMDERIFARLDQLEKGARDDTAHTPVYYTNSTAFQGSDAGGVEGYHEPPLACDAFDQALLRQADLEAQYRLDQTNRPSYEYAPNRFDQSDATPRAARGFDVSQYALNSADAASSSPALNASQRQLLANVHARARPPVAQRRLAPVETHSRHAYPATGSARLQNESLVLEDDPFDGPESFQPSQAPTQLISRPQHPQLKPPVVQGTTLVATHALPDRFRSIFSFPLFNAVQSKSFATVYKTNDNFVLSAPTGSGKTAVLELAILRLLNGCSIGTFKIVYQAPTKSLCSERQRDWQKKFGPLDLQCAELTGDTENTQLRNVQHASIIITTPEKWDSVTRKWKDHRKLVQMVKLFLIDEVHILKEDRGAALEAVVSRMKSVGSDVRFVALSATVPNFQDIATWLGKDPMNPQIPAVKERFGEEFRPVRLQKHVCGYASSGNDFRFDKLLTLKLLDVITKYSGRKPIMIFCITRASCVETAKQLAMWWSTKGPKNRYWSAPRQNIAVAEKDLRDTISSGVVFHHAGLQIQDRAAIEKAYLEGDVNVICCTSTLAVGVNLPCHMVIIKNTVTYSNAGIKEYSDLEIMQMLGRAGRPQFDDSAVAVIMTNSQRVQHYEKMVTGEEILESCLHRNLIDHLNAEIGLGTIDNASSAKRWLSGTFLYVRLKENPEHYKLPGDAPGRYLDDRLETICRNGIAALEEHDLVQATPKLHCTEFGDAMARYYLQFGTMKVILALPPKAKISEILSVVAQADEFKEVRFRSGEKSVYKDLNKNSSIKFPIPVNIDQPAHKVSLIIQAVLGAIELPSDDYKVKNEYNMAKTVVFQHGTRLVRCIIDCQLYLDDAVSVRNALMLARSLAAQVWDDSPLHMKQLEGVGPVAVRKLAVANILTIEDIEAAGAHRLEHIISRHPPYGAQLQEKARAFPRLRVSIKRTGDPIITKGECVTLKVKAELGFLNDKNPEVFSRRPIYVCLLAERSDGHLLHFARISAKKLGKGQEVLFNAKLTDAGQIIRAQVMCDEIAGTGRHASLKPEIPPAAFPPLKTAEEMNAQKGQTMHAPNTSKHRASAVIGRQDADSASDEFGDAGIADTDLVMAETDGFIDVEDLTELDPAPRAKKQRLIDHRQDGGNNEPQQLANGKWACNHACKDKTACKHMCCRDGLDKKPKPKAAKLKDTKKQNPEPIHHPRQTQLGMSGAKKVATSARKDNAQQKLPQSSHKSRDTSSINKLHDSIVKSTAKVPFLGKTTTTPGPSHLSFLASNKPQARKDAEQGSSDYGDVYELADFRGPPTSQVAARMSAPQLPTGMEGFGDDMLDEDFGTDNEKGTKHKARANDGQDDDVVDFSAYSDNLHRTEQPARLSRRLSETLQPQLRTRRNRFGGLFISSNSDNHDPRHSPGIADNRLYTHDYEGSFMPTLSATRPVRLAANEGFQQPPGFSPTVDGNLQAINVFGPEEAATGEERASSGDELEKWFKAEFGTEHFKYVG
ncbi:hypothetical protein LTR62_000047 [Meristemomyces frigidus]|uniref:DNA 3'-5' helicase n=1 Tax=Meristemomyces frigidus TaxID=1508187 RepID=A0AAN7TII1_9PEZI|nr:hypothetical protein LTR62_000047 [Meristemomyces frigidus]